MEKDTNQETLPGANATPGPNICVVALLKGEDRFINEWLAYHRLMGVDHFYLYDNDPRLPLKELTQHHAEYVTVIDWLVDHDAFMPQYPIGTKQEKGYTHFLSNFRDKHDWVAFIDGDEFIVLRKHKDLKVFLHDFAAFDAISLNWHVFGHNGYYGAPPAWILASLTRRMRLPSIQVKTIGKIAAIESVHRGHYLNLKEGSRWVDSNKKEFSEELYPGRTRVAHINHYQSRSFKEWMSRPERGDIGSVQADKVNAWRFDKEECLKKFITAVATNRNEFIDQYMQQYVPLIQEYLKQLIKNKHVV